MQSVPKSLRLQIAIFGRTNAGKSTFLNMIANQNIAITSHLPGTTTDVVEKPMELWPLGPILLLDTAGFDDHSELGQSRMAASTKIFQRADIALLVCQSNIWGETEQMIADMARANNTPLIVIVNKVDLQQPEAAFLEHIRSQKAEALYCSAIDPLERERFLPGFKKALLEVCPEDFVSAPPLLGDLVKPGKFVVLLVPIDIQAPKSRLILPQVQTIRDALDLDVPVVVVKENDFAQTLDLIKDHTQLVVCDSQVVDLMVKNTPDNIPCTTFSILFSRLKADIAAMAQGAAAISNLKAGDKILIAEACSHHATDDDIGRVKIPRLLEKFVGAPLNFTVACGRDYPEKLTEYQLIVHCGSCMLNRRETLHRVTTAVNSAIPITNYGMCISVCQGVAERVLSPFPSALQAFLKQ